MKSLNCYFGVSYSKKKINNKWFTLVEIIVVIIILSVIVTTAVLSLSDWFWRSKDAKRLWDLNVISSWMESFLFSNSYYPDSDNKKIIYYNTGILWSQWEVWKLTTQKLWLDKVPTDPDDGSYYTYALSQDKNKFQLLTYLNSNYYKKISWVFDNSLARDFTKGIPTLKGKNIWVLVDKNTLVPLEKHITSWSINLKNDLVSYKLFLDSESSVIASWDSLVRYLDIFRNDISEYDSSLYLNLTFENQIWNVEIDQSSKSNNPLFPDEVKRYEWLKWNWIYFDGSQSQGGIFQTSSFPLSELTISMWINPLKNPTKKVILLNNSTSKFWVNLNVDLTVGIYNNNGSLINLNEWSNIVVVYSSSSNCRLYLNWVLKNTFNSCWTLDANNLNIWDSGFWWYIDEIRVYNKSFSDEEVKYFFTAYK